MTLLVRSIFSRESPPSPEADEARFVMRIDHLAPNEDPRSNVKYFKDDKLSVRHIASLFLLARRIVLTLRFTPRGYLPDPAVNYDLGPVPAAAPLSTVRTSDLAPEPRVTTAAAVSQGLSAVCLEGGEPRCASAAVSQNLRFIGRLIGRAVFDGIPLGVPLHPLVLLPASHLTRSIRAILASPLSPHALRLIDESLYRSVQRLREQLSADPSLEEELDLYFSVDVTSSVDGRSPRRAEMDLVKGGRARRVSSENVGEYSELLLRHYLFEDYRNTLSFLLDGLFEVIPQELFSVFTEEELAQVLEGEKRAGEVGV